MSRRVSVKNTGRKTTSADKQHLKGGVDARREPLFWKDQPEVVCVFVVVFFLKSFAAICLSGRWDNPPLVPQVFISCHVFTFPTNFNSPDFMCGYSDELTTKELGARRWQKKLRWFSLAERSYYSSFDNKFAQVDILRFLNSQHGVSLFHLYLSRLLRGDICRSTFVRSLQTWFTLSAIPPGRLMQGGWKQLLSVKEACRSLISHIPKVFIFSPKIISFFWKLFHMCRLSWSAFPETLASLVVLC